MGGALNLKRVCTGTDYWWTSFGVGVRLNILKGNILIIWKHWWEQIIKHMGLTHMDLNSFHISIEPNHWFVHRSYCYICVRVREALRQRKVGLSIPDVNWGPNCIVPPATVYFSWQHVPKDVVPQEFAELKVNATHLLLGYSQHSAAHCIAFATLEEEEISAVGKVTSARKVIQQESCACTQQTNPIPSKHQIVRIILLCFILIITLVIFSSSNW